MNYYSDTLFWKRWFREYCKDISSKVIVENRRLYSSRLGTHFIYAIKCPLLRKVFYVGKTSDLMQRIKTHAWENQSNATNVRKFCRRVTRKGRKVKIIILKRCSKKTASKNEAFWIKYFSRKGHPLLNVKHNENK